MSRGLATQTANAYSSTHVRPILFVKIEFDPASAGTIRLHNGLGTYTWNDGSGSVSWQGAGDLGRVSAIQEGDKISPYNIELTLSGLNSTITAEAIKEKYYQRPITVYVGALGDDDALVATPEVIWNGFIDTMDAIWGADEGDTLRLVAESELASFERSNNLLFTNAQQQSEHTGDTFFSHLQEMEDITLHWGKRQDFSGSGGTRVQDDESRNGDPEERN